MMVDMRVAGADLGWRRGDVSGRDERSTVQYRYTDADTEVITFDTPFSLTTHLRQSVKLKK